VDAASSPAGDGTPLPGVRPLATRLRESNLLAHAARVGLVGRAVFYLLLAALTIHLLVEPSNGQQANANGALTTVAGNPLGLGLVIAAAVGFGCFGFARLVGAVADRRQSRGRRLTTAGQGLTYFGMCAVTLRFVAGRGATGSEQSQQDATSSLLHLPAGRLLVGAIGLVVVAVCGWQLAVAARGHFADTLQTEQMSGEVRRLVRWTGRIGIPARALAILPVGVFLVVAALTADPTDAQGLDGYLSNLINDPGGKVLVALIAVGFTVFAVYTFFEARYRQVSSGG
jgi:hypothetical protein